MSREQAEELMISADTPKMPWQKVGIDLYQIKGADYLSRYPEVARLAATTSDLVVNQLKSIFAWHGIPEVVFSDNGTQFISSAFQCFSREYGFRHVMSSPRYPQANGEVERMVKTIKGLIQKCSDPYVALLGCRDTPGPLGKTPAELLMGRPLRTTIPLQPIKLAPRVVNLTRLRAEDRAVREKQRRNINRRHAARNPPPLLPGNSLWVNDCKAAGVVLRKAKHPRSYVIRMDSGVQIERNRRALVLFEPKPAGHLKPKPESVACGSPE